MSDLSPERKVDKRVEFIINDTILKEVAETWIEHTEARVVLGVTGLGRLEALQADNEVFWQTPQAHLLGGLLMLLALRAVPRIVARELLGAREQLYAVVERARTFHFLLDFFIAWPRRELIEARLHLQFNNQKIVNSIIDPKIDC